MGVLVGRRRARALARLGSRRRSYGIGNSFFYPAYTALVPQVLPKDLLVQASALRQFVRPLSMRVIGPALGGAIVAAAGPGTGFLIDAGSFAASAVAILLMTARPASSRRRH